MHGSCSKTVLLACLLPSFLPCSTFAADRPIDRAAFDRADQAIEAAIARKEIPGAVLVAGTSSGIVYRKAYGNRAILPEKDAMTEDTIFDLASLSQSIGCATPGLILLER